MKTYLVREQALRTYKLTEPELDNLINQNKVGTALIINSEGVEYLAIYDDDLAAYTADRDITPEQFEHLRGKLLSMTEATYKYQVSTSVISSWVRQGLLQVKETGPRNSKFIDEADVAYLVELGRAKKMRPGKKPFT